MNHQPESWKALSPDNREFAVIHSRRMIESLVSLKSIPIYELALEEKKDEELAEWIYTNRNAILSHGTQAEPLLNYGNSQALKLWGMRFDEFVGTPSQTTVEAKLCSERAKILARVNQEGLVYPYTGIRIAKNGSRFRIKDAKIWTVQDEKSNAIGTAAMFPDWEFVE